MPNIMDSKGDREKYHELDGATEILLIMALVEVMDSLDSIIARTAEACPNFPGNGDEYEISNDAGEHCPIIGKNDVRAMIF